MLPASGHFLSYYFQYSIFLEEELGVFQPDSLDNIESIDRDSYLSIDRDRESYMSMSLEDQMGIEPTSYTPDSLDIRKQSSSHKEGRVI